MARVSGRLYPNDQEAVDDISQAATSSGWTPIAATEGEVLAFRRGGRLKALLGHDRLTVTLANEGGEVRPAFEIRRFHRRAARSSRLMAGLFGNLNPPYASPALFRERVAGSTERQAIRTLMVLVLLGSVFAGFLVHPPTHCVRAVAGSDTNDHNPQLSAAHHGPRLLATGANSAPVRTVSAKSASMCGAGEESAPDLPGLSLGNSDIYRTEIGLFVFLAALLVITAAMLALFRGELPAEISTSGIRVADPAVASTAKATEDRLKDIEARLAKEEDRSLLP